MTRESLSLAIVFASLIVISGMVPVVAGASTSYLTTGIVQSGIKQVALNGYNGVLVNYTNTYASPMDAFVYLNLVTSAGQVIYWNLGGCTFAAHQKVPCFVVVASTVPKGVYTASVFVTTNTSVPISTTSTMQVTLQE